MNIPEGLPVYKIVHFYREDGKSSRTITSGLTLQEAQLHCRDPKTRKDGVWFDGYDMMPLYAKKYQS